MNKELLGRSGFWHFSSPHTLGWPVRVPVTVIGFGRGRVKVRCRMASGAFTERFVREEELQVRTHFGRKSRVQHCKHKGCPASYVNEFRLERHEAEKHVLCSCGRYFTENGMSRHLAQVTRRGIEHPKQKA